VRELHTDYIKDNIIIKVCYDGGYWVDLVKISDKIKEINNREIRSVDLDYNKVRHYDLKHLDRKEKLLKSINEPDRHKKELEYYSALIRNNPEILNGQLKKFSLLYRFLL